MKDSITEYFTNEQDYPDFDLKGAVDRFCQAIRCKTDKCTLVGAESAEHILPIGLVYVGFFGLSLMISRGQLEVIG